MLRRASLLETGLSTADLYGEDGPDMHADKEKQRPDGRLAFSLYF